MESKYSFDSHFLCSSLSKIYIIWRWHSLKMIYNQKLENRPWGRRESLTKILALKWTFFLSRRKERPDPYDDAAPGSKDTARFRQAGRGIAVALGNAVLYLHICLNLHLHLFTCLSTSVFTPLFIYICLSFYLNLLLHIYQFKSTCLFMCLSIDR